MAMFGGGMYPDFPTLGNRIGEDFMQHAPALPCRLVFVVSTVFAFGAAAGCRQSPAPSSGAAGKAGSPSGGTSGGGGGGSGGKSGSGGSASGGSSGSVGTTTGTGGTGGAGSGGVSGTAGAGSGGSSTGGSRAGGTGGGSGGSTGQGGTGGASGAGGQSTSDTGSAPTLITGLKIDANPKNVLSAFVSWSTDKPSDSVVQFGQGKYEWEISDPAMVTSHKVLIIGMVASKAYQIKAISSAGGKTVSATGNFTAGALPALIPVGKAPINDTTKSQPGWTLVNVIKGKGGTGPVSDQPSMAVMYDANGQPVWYYINGTAKEYGGATSTYLTDKGVLIGPVWGADTGASEESPREVDFAGNTLWECKDPKCGGEGDLTHDTIKISNGNHVVLRWVDTGSGTTATTAPVFEELDASGKVVWSLDYAKLVPMPSGATGDWCHGNSITIDIAKDVVYANCRWMGIVKTTYKNSNTALWYLPASYGKGTGTMTFSPTTSQFSDVHDPEIHDDGTILFFDNGGYDNMMTFPPPPATVHHSRAVEYKIDEAKKTATLVWEFPGTFNVDTWYKNTWYTPYWGDADRLANGNVLVTAGAMGTGSETRIFEVTKSDGKVVWDFRLGPDIGVYRADRITPPLVKAVSQ